MNPKLEAWQNRVLAKAIRQGDHGKKRSAVVYKTVISQAHETPKTHK